MWRIVIHGKTVSNFLSARVVNFFSRLRCGALIVAGRHDAEAYAELSSLAQNGSFGKAFSFSMDFGVLQAATKAERSPAVSLAAIRLRVDSFRESGKNRTAYGLIIDPMSGILHLF